MGWEQGMGWVSGLLMEPSVPQPKFNDLRKISLKSLKVAHCNRTAVEPNLIYNLEKINLATELKIINTTDSS